MSYQANGVTVTVTVDFSTGASFGYSFILGDPAHGVLGQNVLADAASNVVDVSSQVGKISIKGGSNLFSRPISSSYSQDKNLRSNGHLESTECN